MADVLRRLYREVTSQTGAAVQSPPAHIGGNAFDFRFAAQEAHTGTPPTVTLQVSVDKLNWSTADREGGVASFPATTGTPVAEAADSDFVAVLQRARYARFQVAADAEGARTYQGVFVVHKQE